MSKLAQLRERRNAKAQEANTLNAKYPADQRMPADEAGKLDALLAEIEAVDEDIKREARVAQLAAEQTDTLLNRVRDDATKEPGKHSEVSKALRAYLRDGIAGLNEQQRNEMLARQTPDIRAAMSTTTTTEGGYTVATEYQRSLEAAMKAYSGMLEVSTIIQTGSGATMNFPTADATAEVGEIVGQNAAATALDTAFGNTALDTYKYSSKKIALPWELVQDSFLDIEAYIQSVLAVRLGRILNTHFTVGTGSGQPRGIVVGSALGKTGTTGQTTTVIYDDLVDLEHSINRAYRSSPKFGFMMADSSLKVVRKIKDGQSRPIFVPGYESGVPGPSGSAPDRLLGRPITINDDVAAMAANAKSILCGDFGKYVVRRVMDLTMFRMTDSAFTLNGQVGFVAFQRCGGNLIDAGGSVKYYANSAT
jgi:HK97 family phage major capsid protein